MRMIFIHGSGHTSIFWHYQTSYFKTSEAISLPGHPEGKPCTSVREYTDWLRGYIREMDYNGVILVGHSLGGAIAMDYGLRYAGDLKALILIGTGARLRVHPDFLAWCEDGIQNVAEWMKNWEPTYALVPPELRERLLEETRLVGPGVQLRDLLCCDKFDVMADIHRIELPTLVLCGSEDQMTPVKYSQFLAGKIKGARLVVIEGGTHLVPAEKPAEVNQAIEEFLGSLRDSDYPDR
ncbi:alpha/beta hydrolase [Dehalococcoidia bacterium]|nr:alpha/beta hydrolase [Dehalococcoidia bacterium]